MAEPTKPTKASGIAAPVALPRRVIATKTPVSDPGYRKDNLVITDQEQKFFNVGVNDLRSQDPIQAIRILTRINGTFSAALGSYLSLAMSSGFRVTGYTVGTHQFDPQATLSAMSIIAALDTLYDYTEGYSSRQSVQGLLETLHKEVLQTGACMAELVLNKFRLPEEIVPIPVTSLRWQGTTSGRRYPEQKAMAGGYIPLDLPTIMYASSAQQSNSIFPRSQFESALNMIYMYTELLEDIFKVIRRSGHTRLVAKILQESVQKMAPPEVQADPEKMTKFFEDARTQVQDVLTRLNPEDALVAYDSVEIDSLSAAGDKSDYTAILETMNGMLASSLKTMPSMLGMRTGGSQSLSNTESLTFLKMVASTRTPVETVMSRALTLAVRLVSATDSYITFEFKSIELRTESELSAHRAIIQQDIMRKLSMGYLTDDEAAHMMDMFPRAPGAPNLSGTGFMDPVTQVPVTLPKDVATAGQGPQEKSGTSGNKTGIPNPSGGGNPKG